MVISSNLFTLPGFKDPDFNARPIIATDLCGMNWAI